MPLTADERQLLLDEIAKLEAAQQPVSERAFLISLVIVWMAAVAIALFAVVL